MKKILVLVLFLWLPFSDVFSQTFKVDKSTLVYKTIGTSILEMVVYRPQVSNSQIKLPALVLFFGGGWVSGDPSHFELQANYFASRGMVVFCPDYRTNSKFGTTPFESVKDAKSAIRYLKLNGNELGIDTSKIVAGGGSAGGHLAACTAIIDNFNEDSDDLSVSTIPMLLVLFNPVVDTGKRGYGQEKLEGREFELSPVHHITAGVPPALIMHGKTDTTVPYENVVRFKQVMKQEGNKCILAGYKHQKHGFFNYSKNPKHFKKTLKKSESFLEDNGLLRGDSWIRKYYRELRSDS